jgi:hypothetical protein
MHRLHALAAAESFLRPWLWVAQRFNAVIKPFAFVRALASEVLGQEFFSERLPTAAQTRWSAHPEFSTEILFFLACANPTPGRRW